MLYTPFLFPDSASTYFDMPAVVVLSRSNHRHKYRYYNIQAINSGGKPSFHQNYEIQLHRIQHWGSLFPCILSSTDQLSYYLNMHAKNITYVWTTK